MAKAKQRRKRKHRGTQGGSIDPRARRSRPRTREEAKAQARRRRTSKKGKAQPKQDRVPTWRGATVRAVFAAGVFGILMLLFFKQRASQAIALGCVMFLVYIPMGYYIDRFMYARRQRARQRAYEQRKAE